ncbi:DNA gyrase inhibitor YacG [Myxococcota bacterium]|nr:DNA gyrase inhibitor YacG [Myxococcota bacterium]
MSLPERTCPICGRPSAPPGERSPRPFCTPRCQMVDLGRWLNEDYVVSVPTEPLALGPESGAGDDDGDGHDDRER